MSKEQKIRAWLFYLSVAIFFLGLPYILSFSLGYKFNPRTLQFTKTGLISLKTQPEGASVYLNGKPLEIKTPATIDELMPGVYNIRLELEQHYTWAAQVNVWPRQVTRLEKILLFPVRPNIKQLNQDRVTHFWLSKESGRIYYYDKERNIIYSSDLGAERFEEVDSLPDEFLSVPKELKISPDKEKLLLYNARQILVMYLKPRRPSSYAKQPVVLNYSKHQINNVFWHSNSYHLIIITDKNIEISESHQKPNTVVLANLNKKAKTIYYDTDNDLLYFMDAQKGSDGINYDNVYSLDLSNKTFIFDDLMKLRKNAN